ncbi:SMI1/KNR4 family protein [Marinomonas sp.]|uniref:SMI1/KNR4 family protein n=1 Tax=Marinomonas sp. TaxID=1904862 RepID=UPI003BAA0EC8
MLIENLKKLGARSLENDSLDKGSISQVESELNITFTDGYESVLKSFDNSIVFDHGTIYKPVQNSPVDTSDGYQSLEMLYGLQGASNLVDKNKMYKDQIPEDCVVIGESIGGSQICLSRSSGKVYFWFHEAEFDDSSLFEISPVVDDFIKRLVRDEIVAGNRDVDESGSFLDF